MGVSWPTALLPKPGTHPSILQSIKTLCRYIRIDNPPCLAISCLSSLRPAGIIRSVHKRTVHRSHQKSEESLPISPGPTRGLIAPYTAITLNLNGAIASAAWLLWLSMTTLFPMDVPICQHPCGCFFVKPWPLSLLQTYCFILISFMYTDHIVLLVSLASWRDTLSMKRRFTVMIFNVISWMV